MQNLKNVDISPKEIIIRKKFFDAYGIPQTNEECESMTVQQKVSFCFKYDHDRWYYQQKQPKQPKLNDYYPGYMSDNDDYHYMDDPKNDIDYW
jgi:hypothetical protein